ncbi:MAG: hypothetical protein E6344_18770 [Clostridium sp.]|nr:hypothetical protein [Clostridium sp.]MDU7085741.1 hypothetical protein [Clostridium sp.]
MENEIKEMQNQILELTYKLSTINNFCIELENKLKDLQYEVTYGKGFMSKNRLGVPTW